MDYLLPPAAMGLPEKYTQWRQNQADAVWKAVNNDRRVMISVCPTGFGKSLMYVAAGLIMGGKVVILTSTKGLQDQLYSDFASIGMVIVKGKNAYKCVESNNKLHCDQGMCNFGMHCPLRKGGCEYYDAVRRASKANLVVTNYSFWLYSNTFSEGIGQPNLLVCDEGHDAPEEVAAFLEVKLNRSDEMLSRILPRDPENTSIKEWKAWGTQQYQNIEYDISVLMNEVREDPDEYNTKKLARLRTLLKDLGTLKSMDVSNWVCNVTPFVIQIAPITVSGYCSSTLFMKVPNVILTSGSINYKTGELLGLDDDEYNLVEYEHTFPLESRIVYLIKGARMNANTDYEALADWLWAADDVIGNRLDRKGIFHTTSYARRDFVMAHSKHRMAMMSHRRHDVVQMINFFKNAPPPRVFVSPSVTTGWDFPYETTRYQIIGKVPYPDSRNVVVAARNSADEEYSPYIAMQQIVQACGRGTRAPDDWCENFIIDDNFGSWFLRRYRKFAPRWFLDSITRWQVAPEPPPIRKGGR